MCDAGLRGSGILLNAIEEVRAGEDASHSGANSVIEGALVLPCTFVEGQRRFQIFGGDGAAVGAAGEGREDLGCAVGLIQSGRSRVTNEELPSAGTFADTFHVVRA